MILVPEVARDFQKLMLVKYELKVLPVMHTMGYRHLIYLDVKNEFGCARTPWCPCLGGTNPYAMW